MSARKTSCRLAGFELAAADAARLARFYEHAFDCRRIASQYLHGTDFEELMGVQGGADRIALSLGLEAVGLLQFDNPGRPYPANSLASDLIFQHFAIVVSDMARAWQRLCTAPGWSAITQGGPQRLPESSGGVTAFKFRDPEGHPLELLAYPAGNTPSKWRRKSNDGICLGIDHSAIVVTDTAVSSAFYEALGFRVSAQSLNRGAEQEKLDDLRGVQVAVTALSPADNGPHIELLHYRSVVADAPAAGRSNDIASARLVLETPRESTAAEDGPRSVLDPDGHRLTVIPAA